MKANVVKMLMVSAVISALTACGGGGGGVSGGSGGVLYYPYETVFGQVCTTFEATPGCTFKTSTGERITVVEDPDYDQYGYGSDDLWFVEFDASGRGSVYNDLGRFQYFIDVSALPGYVGGTTIGVGTTGLFWENVSNGTYWLGKNDVLYNANIGESNFGEAINNDGASEASDSNFSAMNSETNKLLVQKAADSLVSEYGFKKDKATAIASALNSWAVANTENGYTTTKDMDKAFKSVFGVEFIDALAAAKDLVNGQTQSMESLTNRSAAALGLKPHQAQKFLKGMYKKALADWGYDTDSFNW